MKVSPLEKPIKDVENKQIQSFQVQIIGRAARLVPLEGEII